MYMKKIINSLVVPVCLLTPLAVLSANKFNNTLTSDDFVIALAFFLFGILAEILTFDNKS